MNPYDSHHTPLKRARLPVPPLPRMLSLLRQHYILYSFFRKCQGVFTNFFKGCVKLANVNFTGKGQTCYAPNMGFNETPLTRESLVSFFNVLSPHIGYKPMGSSNQLAIHRYSYLLLSVQDIAIATDKGWIITQATS